MLLRSSDKKLTKKGRYSRAAVVILGVPLFLMVVYALEGLNNPNLFSRDYLIAEYGPTLMWPWHNGYRAFEKDTSLISASAVKALPAGTVTALSNLLSNFELGQDKIPRLVLDVKFKDMSKVFLQREEALRRGRLIQTDDSFVKGKIREDAGNIPVKLRLKGDWLEHLHGRKWSFRIHTRKGEQYLGMRRFSVQHPKVRGYHSEKIYADLLRRYDVLSPRHMLVNMMLNGEELGIMAIEEHFSKELLEAQSRREGIIVRFDESLVWLSPDGGARNFEGIYDDYRNSTIDTFRSSKVLESPVFSKHYAAATGLLRGFANGDLRASEVFDAHSLGAYLAISEVFGAYHALRWHNQRFYVNPITLKLEPIGFDANVDKSRELGNVSVIRTEPLSAAMLQDPVVMKRFREVLNQLAADAESGKLLEQLQETEQQFYDLLRTEYLYLQPFPVATVPERALQLVSASDEFFVGSEPREIVGMVAAEEYPIPVHAYRILDGDTEYLELKNAIPHEVHVAGIIPAGVGTEPPLLSAQGFPATLAPRELGTVGDAVRIELPDQLRDAELLVTGTAGAKEFDVPITPYFPALSAPAIPVGRIDDILATYSFLELNAADRSITFVPGTWDIPELISFPTGYSVAMGPGTDLRFGHEAGLIVRGPVSFTGTADQPVRLGPTDTDDAATWLGLAILEAGDQSEWQHVEIEDTRGMSVDAWLLMGGTNFYHSPVTIENSAIRHHQGEDGLNIISSKFTTRGLIIEDTLSDGFDCDFCTGEILGGQFSKIGTAGGGDAIDVSVSNISIDGVTFDNISDKAVSIGEQSRATATDLTITASGTGAAAKDGSYLLLENTTITGAKVSALMAYIKKPEFGSAELIANNLTLSDNRTIAIAQTGSSISIDGVPVEAKDVDVDAMYDTIMRPGLRRPSPEPEVEKSNARP